MVSCSVMLTCTLKQKRRQCYINCQVHGSIKHLHRRAALLALLPVVVWIDGKSIGAELLSANRPSDWISVFFKLRDLVCLLPSRLGWFNPLWELFRFKLLPLISVLTIVVCFTCKYLEGYLRKFPYPSSAKCWILKSIRN